MAESNIRLRVDASQAVAQLRQVNGSVKRLGANFGRVQAGAGRLQSAIAGIGLTLIAKQAVGAAASFNDLQTRLKLLTSEYGEFEQAQDLVARSAKTFGLSNREAAEGITDIFARLRPLGVSLRDIESTFVGFNSVAKLSGVNAVQANAAFTQLAQALGSGALRGDEFNSIADQVPGLLTAISQETGVAQGKLREYAAEGKITSKVVISALKRIEKEGGDKIKKLIEQSDVQKFKNFENAVDKLSVAIGSKLLPIVTPLITKITELIDGFAALPKPVQDTTVAVGALALAVGVLGPAIKGLTGAIGIFNGAAVISAAISGTAALGEKALAAAAGKKALAAAVTAANAKITVATVSVGLLKLALLALPFVAVAGSIAFYISEVNKAKQAQETFNNLLATGTEQQLNQALATEKATLALIAQRKEKNKNAMGGRVGVGDFPETIEEGRAKRRIKGILDALKNRIANRPPAVESPTDPTDLTALDDLDKSKTDPRIAARKNALEEIQQLQDQTNVLKARNEEEARMVQLQQQIRDVNKERALIGDELADKQIHEIRRQFSINELQLFKQQRDQEIADQQQKNAENLKKAQDAEAQRSKELAQRYQGIADTIANGVVDALKGAVMGTQTLAESASNLLNNLANDLLMVAKNMLFFGSLGGGLSKGSGLLGNLFGGFLADGGTATGGRSFVVGERGPELFTPGRTGSVTPNSALGGANVTVNVDASGTQVQGDGASASQLGRVIGAAVQSELIKQKRPGGLLAR
jgi:tape measure domain-containing protein